MKRREIIAGGIVGGFGGIAGCLAEFGDGGEPTENSSDTERNNHSNNEDTADRPEMQDVPDRPSELTPDSAREYVREYEEVQQHNEKVGSATSISTDCSTGLDHETTDEYYVSTVCFVSYSAAGGVGQEFSNETLYLVTPDETIRIEPAQSEYPDSYVSEDQVPNDAHGLWLSNFDDEAHELSIQVVHDSKQSVEVLNETYDLPAKDGILINDVAGIDGSYEVQATIVDGPATTETFDVASYESGSEIFGAVHITPETAVTARTIEFEKPRS